MFFKGTVSTRAKGAGAEGTLLISSGVKGFFILYYLHSLFQFPVSFLFSSAAVLAAQCVAERPSAGSDKQHRQNHWQCHTSSPGDADAEEADADADAEEADEALKAKTYCSTIPGH